MTTTSSIVRLPADYIPRLEILADTLGVHMSEAITRLIDAELERQGRLDDVPLGEHEFEALGDDGVISWRGIAGTFVWTRKLAAEVAETLDGFADKSLRGQMHLVEAGVIIGRRGSGVTIASADRPTATTSYAASVAREIARLLRRTVRSL